MWGFLDCTHYYMTTGTPKVVLSNASAVFATHEKVGLLVPPGEGKSTIVRLLAGVERPRYGEVLRDKGGWPLGYGGAFRLQMSGDENVRNVAMMVGLDPIEVSVFCAEFSELGADYFQPLERYSGSMRGRLAFALTMAIPATTYLADEKLTYGYGAFRDKVDESLAQRLETAGLILVCSNPRATEAVCDRHGVVAGGHIVMCESHEEAKEVYNLSVENSSGEILDDDLVSFDLA